MKKLITLILVSVFSMVPVASSYAWEVMDATDDFGDKRVVVQTFFISGVPQFDNPDNFDFTDYESSLMAGLMFRCQEREFSAFIPVSRGISFDEPTIKTSSTVSVKFNGGSSVSLKISPNERTAIWFKDPRSLFAKLSKSRTFAIKVNTGSGIPFSANWNVSGLAKYKLALTQAGCKV